jgi:hypothetical protein
MLRQCASALLTTSLFASSILVASPGALAQDQGARWSKTPRWADDQPVRENQERPQVEPRSSLTPFSPGSNNLSLDVGQIFLYGDIGGDYADAIGFQLRNVHAVSDIFGLDTSLGFSSHGPATDANGFSMSHLKFGLRTNLAWYDKAIPYGVFGLGFFRPSYEQDSGSNLTALLFGLSLGGGVNLEISETLFFGASLTFNDMFGTRKRNSSNEVQEVDGSFAAFLVSAGVSF